LKIVQFIRIILNNLQYIFGVGILAAILVFLLTKDEPKIFESNAIVYTGIATGFNVENLENARFDFNSNNTSFDNLINIIKSRQTSIDVALKLFATHLSLSKNDPFYISYESYEKFKELSSDPEIQSLAVKGDIEKTYANILKNYSENQNKSGFFYRLLNSSHNYYSINALKKLSVRRISSSDLLELKYETNDPAICRLSLDYFIEIFSRNYRLVKENQAIAVVDYFEKHLKIAYDELQIAEDNLLAFNRDNNLINYYEQTKSIAGKNDDLEKQFQDELMSFSGTKAKLKELEDKIVNQEKVNIDNSNILIAREKLNNISLEIANIELSSHPDTSTINKLKNEATLLKNKIELQIGQLFKYSNSREGIAIEKIVNDWLNTVIEYESTKAKLQAFDKRKNDFNKLYRTFAPLGAQMKRLERAINVAEQSYLEILHGLSLARLKEQNIGLSTNIKIVDKPYTPLDPRASKRKILIVIALLAGMFLVTTFVLAVEFFDKNIKSLDKAVSQTAKNPNTIIPKTNNLNPDVSSIVVRQSINHALNNINSHQNNTIDKKPMIVLIFSILKSEGKSFIIKHLIDQSNSNGIKSIGIVPSSEKISTLENNVLKYQYNQEFIQTQSICNYFNEFNFSIIDTVYLEIPCLLGNIVPFRILRQIDYALLIVRANRAWTESDKNQLETFEKSLHSPIEVIVNGAEIVEIECIVSEIEKKRSLIRRTFKKIIQRQFKLKRSI